MIGALAWMNLVSGDSSLLDQASALLTKSLSLFFTTDSITELCESTRAGCSRDAQGFKAIYVRNLAYLYRQTSDSGVKSAIQKAIDSSVTAMVTRACDSSWNCNGSASLCAGMRLIARRLDDRVGAGQVHSISARRVGPARGLARHSCVLHGCVKLEWPRADGAGTGLLTNVNQAALNATGSGNTKGGISGNVGSVTSQPLGAASGLVFASSPYAALFAASAGLLAIAASTLA